VTAASRAGGDLDGGAGGDLDGGAGGDGGRGSRPVLAERFAAQLLTGEPAASVLDVVRRLLAVQAQDPRGARLAIRARSAGLTAADVDRALTDERSLLITWLNRGTLHLIRSEDYWWLHSLTAPQSSAASTRRLAQEGVPPADADRAVAVIEAALAGGPMTRACLRERIDSAGLRTEGQALVHLLVLASRRCHIVRGPMIGAEHAFVLAADWLGPPQPSADRDAALAELARRYLAGHGPAADRDLARWAGLPLRDARRGLAAIGDSLSRRGDGLASLAAGPGRTADRGETAAPTDPGGTVDRGETAAPAAPGGTADRRGTAAPAAPGGTADRRGTAAPAAPGGTADRGGTAEPRSLGFPPPRLLGAYDPVLHGWVSRAPVLGDHQARVISNGLFRPFALVGGRGVGTWSLAGGKVTLAPFAPLAAAAAAALRSDAADVLRFLGLSPSPLMIMETSRCADPPKSPQ
jgi:hypothetical protein